MSAVPGAADAQSAAGWRLRTAVIAVAALAGAHVLAAIGLYRGMPPAPWGDEAQYWSDLAGQALLIVWQPWSSSSPDELAPAGYARLVVPVILLWIAGEWLFRQLRNPLRLMRIARRGDHAVLLGLAPLARHVLAYWNAAARATLVVSDRHDEEAAAIAGGAALVESDWHVEDMPRRAILGRAASVACVSGTDAENIEAAVGVTRAVESLRDAGTSPLVVFIKVEDPFLRARIDERIDRFASLDRVQLRLFSAAQIAVRRLLREFPVERYVHAGQSAPRIWIFGFGTWGEDLALQAIRLAPAGRETAPVISIVDLTATARRRPFLMRWPGAEAVATLRFLDGLAEEGEALLSRLLEPDAQPPSCVYFCHAEEAQNLSGALALCAAMRARGTPIPPLYLLGSARALQQMDADLAAHPWVHGFGDDAAVAQEFLMGERLDASARSIHESYLAEAQQRGEEMGARRSLRPWVLLPEDLKDDNRALADHFFVKMGLVGCALGEKRGGEAVDPKWTDAEVERLSEFEHERWARQRLLAGWRHAAKRDDQQKQHPDLVPYGELSEPKKELDRDVVRDIPSRLAGVGFSVRRERPTEVSGPPSPWTFAPAFDEAAKAALAALRREAPEAEPVVWTGLRSAMACRVAELASAAGMRIGIAMDESASTCLARQPTDEIRARVARLLRDAKQVRMGTGGAAPQAVRRVRLSIDGSDVQPTPDAWGIDSAGRVLFRPEGIAA